MLLSFSPASPPGAACRLQVTGTRIPLLLREDFTSEAKEMAIRAPMAAARPYAEMAQMGGTRPGCAWVNLFSTIAHAGRAMLWLPQS